MASLLHYLCKDEGREKKRVDYVEGFPHRFLCMHEVDFTLMSFLGEILNEF